MRPQRSPPSRRTYQREPRLLREVAAKHGRFVIDTRDEFIGAHLATSGEYAEEELALLSWCSEQALDTLIVGAHIGALAVPLSRCSRSLVAVEANPATFGLLQRNVELNDCKNVELRLGAASDACGELEFLCGTKNSGGSKRVPMKRREDYYYDQPEQLTVQAFRLDDFYSGRKFALAHFDIEGSEVFALRGAQAILPSVKYLSVEFISHHLTHVAGVTVEEWLAPIRPHYSVMLVPGSTQYNRPSYALEPADWREMLQNIVDAGVGHEGIIFFNA